MLFILIAETNDNNDDGEGREEEREEPKRKFEKYNWNREFDSRCISNLFFVKRQLASIFIFENVFSVLCYSWFCQLCLMSRKLGRISEESVLRKWWYSCEGHIYRKIDTCP